MSATNDAGCSTMLSRLLAATRKRSSFRTTYDTFVVLGDPSSEPIWHSGRWTAIAQQLDPIVAALDGSGVLTVHLKSGVEDIFLDGLAWGDEANRAWPHEATERDLLTMELWVPGRKRCDERGIFPDLFFAFRNEACVFRNVLTTFNPYSVLASAQDLPATVREQVRGLAVLIADMTKAVVRAEQARPWGMAFGKSGYANAIGDLMSTDVFKIGAAHRQQPSIAMLEGQWIPF